MEPSKATRLRAPRPTGEALIAAIQQETHDWWHDAKTGVRPGWRDRETVAVLIGEPAGRLYHLEPPLTEAAQFIRKSVIESTPGGMSLTGAFRVLDEYRYNRSQRQVARENAIGPDEAACEDVLLEVPKALKKWLATAKDALNAVDNRHREDVPPDYDPTLAAGDDGEFMRRLRTVVGLVTELARAADQRNEERRSEQTRRAEVLDALFEWFCRERPGQEPTKQELAAATILCGIVPNLNPSDAKIAGMPTVKEVIRGERRTAHEALRRRREALRRAA